MKDSKYKEKSFDAIIANLLRELEREFRLATPIFILLIDPDTQCFHYFGKEYYIEKITERIRQGSLKFSQLKKTLSYLKAQITGNNSLEAYYEKYGLSKSADDIKGKSLKDLVEEFVKLLIHTPCSRHYGMTGRIYHTRIPIFCYSRKQFRKSGVLKFIEDDPILYGARDVLKDVIDKCEEFLWGGDVYKRIKSSIMSPIYLFGQIIGNAFVTNNKEFSYYDYLRFLQIVKEFTMTSMKDAKGFEFLAKVIQSLPNKNFKAVHAIFDNLHVLFGISAACLRYKNKCYRSIFTRTDSLLPQWQKNSCHCEQNFFEGPVIGAKDICVKIPVDTLLGIKSGLRLLINNTEVVLYFNFSPELMGINEKQLKLEVVDAFEIIGLAEKNLEFYKAYGHDTNRFLNRVNLNDNLKELLINRSELMQVLAGDISEVKLATIRGTILREKIRSLYKLVKKAYTSTDPRFRSPMLRIVMNGNSYNIYWPAIETVLNNLFGNAMKHKADKPAKQNIVLKMLIQDKCLLMEYSLSGENIQFGASPENIQAWLRGEYGTPEAPNKGFGHYIIQYIVDSFDGNFEVIIVYKREAISIGKKSIKKVVYVDSNAEVVYRIYFPQKLEGA